MPDEKEGSSARRNEKESTEKGKGSVKREGRENVRRRGRGRNERNVRGGKGKGRKKGNESADERRREREKERKGGNVSEGERGESSGTLRKIHIEKGGPDIMITSLGTTTTSLENTNFVAEIMIHGWTAQDTSRETRADRVNLNTIIVAKRNPAVMKPLDKVEKMTGNTIIGQPDIQLKYHRHLNLNRPSKLCKCQNLSLFDVCPLSVHDPFLSFPRRMR